MDIRPGLAETSVAGPGPVQLPHSDDHGGRLGHPRFLVTLRSALMPGGKLFWKGNTVQNVSPFIFLSFSENVLPTIGCPLYLLS